MKEMFHVKHMDSRGLREALQDHLVATGVVVDTRQVDLLLQHLNLVLRVNEETNLTAIRGPEEALRLHTLDSIEALEFVPPLTATLADIGSGQGYPAIPFAVLRSEMRVTMVEANAKKAQFLRLAVTRLGIDGRADVLNCRAESVPPAHLNAYDVVTARAVASLASLVELASPLLRDGGVLLAMKGSPEPTELVAGDQAAVRCGMSPGVPRTYKLRNGGEARSVLMYQKVGAPAVQLPRRVGLAQKRPLR